MSDSFRRCGKINTSDAFWDMLSCKLIIALCEAWTILLLGRYAIGPFLRACTSFKNLQCVDLKKCLDAPESNFALNVSDDMFVCLAEATGEYICSNKILFNLSIAKRIDLFINPVSPGLH